MEDLEEAANGDDQPPAISSNDVGKYDQDHHSRKRLKFDDEAGDDDDEEEEEEDDDDIDREGAGYASDPEIGTA